ncbi:MAG TPA: helix-hairpin-helix domain-containing protein [Gaiellaceae bacterium]
MSASDELDNARLAATLDEYAALLELDGAGTFPVRAYRRAADLIRAAPAPVAELVRKGRVRELRGIGPSIEARLRELVTTGRIAELEELRGRTAPELVALGRLLGFGPRLAAAIAEALEIRTAAELRAAAAAGRLREVPGIGPRTEAKILAALERGEPAPAQSRPLLLNRARTLSEQVAAALDGVTAGEPRRWKDAVTRLAIVVPTTEPDRVRERFAALPEIVALAAPDLGMTLDGLPIELVVTPPAAFGTALVRATGAPEYVATLGPVPDAHDEHAVYRLLGLPYLEPELRELPGPTDPAALVGVDDIRGDLHCHTTWSDGRATVLEMATAARERGYDYLAICDHTTNVRVVPGLDADDLRRQGDEIRAANELLAPFRVLRGTECDILPDGSLDLPDDVLAELDWVQLSLHAGQRTPRRELTARVTHAMRHPGVRCLSHPTGRLIGHRPENALDLERTFEVALETGVALEVNGLPARLDLSGDNVRLALEAGVQISCSTDAHSTAGLDNIALSVHTARRGRARAADVLNTRPLGGLLSDEIL